MYISTMRYWYGQLQGKLDSRTLAPATMSSQAGVAGAHFIITSSSRRNTVATCTASPTCPLAEAWPR